MLERRVIRLHHQLRPPDIALSAARTRPGRWHDTRRNRKQRDGHSEPVLTRMVNRWVLNFLWVIRHASGTDGFDTPFEPNVVVREI